VSLVTRCPVCGTAYRVQRDQLAARAGKVRCGKCAAVFDGVSALVEEGGERLAIDPSPQLGLFDPSRRPAPAPAKEEKTNEPLPEWVEPEAPPRFRWLWGVAAVLAAVLLVAQAAYRYRAELVAYAPEARAPLEALCRPLACDVTLPRRLKQLALDSYEVREHPQHDGVLVLDFVISNRAPFAQEYPALKLALTDGSGAAVASRVLLPREYLDSRVAAALLRRGIDAESTASVTVYLDVSRVRATNYKVDFFYPS
jgi:predicted Zn finger-like uncharacterized protein